MQRLPPSIHSTESFYKMIRQPNKSRQPLHAADSLKLPPVCKKNTNVSYQWWEQRLPQLYARVCWAITGKHCKALFRSTETSWSSEWDGNELTKKDLHQNKRKGSWEKKSEIMLMNWSPGLMWNTVSFLVCQCKKLKQWTPTSFPSWSGLGAKSSELQVLQNDSNSNLETRLL